MSAPVSITRASRKPFTVKPLPADRGPAPEKGTGAPAQQSDQPRQPSGRDRLYAAARTAAAQGGTALSRFREGLTDQQDGALTPILPELDAAAADADARDEDTFAGDLPDSEAA
ncbi:hypothetical protein MKK64_17295 [Methylobacterium sp. E-025]|uniref:hypothetical protein n=1 Tax=Methylobacterium sp. E-025 TaxID=2836561 RepID=UPI001FB8D969|nr:hypothetical protein [Methylobacterium sp. E-025]MCJ2112939.1 hypothetical protein [Methylobacterium sp. E-025]